MLKNKRPFVALSIISALLALAAWITFMYQGQWGIAVAFVALACSIFSLKLPRGAARNLAITSLIASAILIIVVVIFYFVLNTVLKTL